MIIITIIVILMFMIIMNIITINDHHDRHNCDHHTKKSDLCTARQSMNTSNFVSMVRKIMISITTCLARVISAGLPRAICRRTWRKTRWPAASELYYGCCKTMMMMMMMRGRLTCPSPSVDGHEEKLDDRLQNYLILWEWFNPCQ